MISFAAVQFYDVVLFFHILAVVLAFGPTFAYPVFLAVAEKHDPRALPAVGRGIQAWEKIGNPMLVVLLAAGLYLVIEDGGRGWSFGDFYISWGIGYLIVLGAIVGMFFSPQTQKAIEIAERDIAASGPGEVKLSQEFHDLNKKIGTVGQIVGILSIITIYIMTAKPFL